MSPFLLRVARGSPGRGFPRWLRQVAARLRGSGCRRCAAPRGSGTARAGGAGTPPRVLSSWIRVPQRLGSAPRLGLWPEGLRHAWVWTRVGREVVGAARCLHVLGVANAGGNHLLHPPPLPKFLLEGVNLGIGMEGNAGDLQGCVSCSPPQSPHRPPSLRVPGLCSCALPCSLIASVITSVSDLRAGWASEKEEKELLGVCTCPYICIWASESENGTGICHLRPNGRLSGHQGSALQPLARVCRSLVAAAARNQWAQVTPNPPWGCQGQGFPS